MAGDKLLPSKIKKVSWWNKTRSSVEKRIYRSKETISKYAELQKLQEDQREKK